MEDTAQKQIQKQILKNYVEMYNLINLVSHHPPKTIKAGYKLLQKQ